MCGIAGIASRVPVMERAWLAAGSAAMRHRGPDDQGEWWSRDGRAGLAHRRLSIVDLSPAGHQPMIDRASDLAIVFNGEIYNFTTLRTELAAKGHTFRSGTDTEVILAAYREWETDCLTHFAGMFAFAVYDASRRRLFLARDRAGEKPLFYAESGGALRFASELKGLLADPHLPRRVEARALDCYLAMGYAPGEQSILQGISKLPPAHALTFDLDAGSRRVWRYWTLPELRAPDIVSAESAARTLENLLETAVRGQMVADVPVGVLLSGGVDSSLITALAARVASTVRTFTIRFPGHGVYDETRHARLVATHFATEHHELDAADATPDLLPVLARQFDEPIVDSSMIPMHIVSALVRGHCTVALGGDGGDELFGGYAHYTRLARMQHRLQRVPVGVRTFAAGVAEALMPVGAKGRNWLQTLDVDAASQLPLRSSLFDRRTRARLLGPRAAVGAAERIRAARMAGGTDIIQRATRTDAENYLAEDILVKIDRASMLNSLEVRAPFLDHRVIEFAFRDVPSSLKANSGERKILLKRLASMLLPPAFDANRKQGFSVPLAAWLRTDRWRSAFRTVLLEGGGAGAFNREAAAALLDGQARGRANSERLFALVLFELWRREYRVEMPTA